MNFNEQQELVKTYLERGDRKRVAEACNVSLPIVTMALNAKSETELTPATRLAWKGLVAIATANMKKKLALIARTGEQLNSVTK